MINARDLKGAKRSWGMAAFGLVFVVTGLAAAYFTGGRLTVDYLNSNDWVSVPADVVELELVSKRGSESTTYSVQGKFQYQYNGVRYTGSRISLSTGSDNISSYWQDLYSELDAKRANSAVSAWVNPDDPTQAILDRTYRWESVVFGLIFVLMFTGIGSVITWFSLRQQPNREQQLILDSKHGISSNEKHSGAFIIGFGSLFFLVGSLVSILVLPDEIANGNYPALLVLVFVIVGLGLMRLGFKQSSQYKRIGPTPIFLDPAAPCLAGELGAYFTIPSAALSTRNLDDTHIEATLRCMRSVKSGKSTRKIELYQSVVPVFLKQGSNGIKAICKFDIPADCEPTKELENNQRTYWQLTVKGDLTSHAMGRLKRTWEVHVDNTNKGLTSDLHIPQAFLEHADAQLANAALAKASQQVLLSENAQFLEIISPASQNLMGKIIGLVVGAVFACVGYLLVSQNQWFGYLVLMLGCFVFLASLFALGSAIHCKIDKPASLFHVRRSWFGFNFSQQDYAIFNPEQLSAKSHSSVQSGGEITKYYDLYLEYNGKKRKIAKALKGARAAEAIKKTITDAVFKQA